MPTVAVQRVAPMHSSRLIEPRALVAPRRAAPHGAVPAAKMPSRPRRTCAACWRPRLQPAARQSLGRAGRRAAAASAGAASWSAGRGDVPDLPGGVQLGRDAHGLDRGGHGGARNTAAHLPAGRCASLLVDGVIAGAGAVLVFLPQILILFFFILAARGLAATCRAPPTCSTGSWAAWVCSGRAFIPLLSSFACAIPGIMATRTIPSWRDRLTTIMIAPLMTCSARLPVYALLIGALHSRAKSRTLQPAGPGAVRAVRGRHRLRGASWPSS